MIPLHFDTMISIFLFCPLGDIRDSTSDSILSYQLTHTVTHDRALMAIPKLYLPDTLATLPLMLTKVLLPHIHQKSSAFPPSP